MKFCILFAAGLLISSSALSEPVYFYESTIDGKMQVTVKTAGGECEKSKFSTYQEIVSAEEKRVNSLPPVNGNKCAGRLEGSSLKSKRFEKEEQISIVVDCGAGAAEMITFVKNARKCKVILDGIRMVEAARLKK